MNDNVPDATDGSNDNQPLFVAGGLAVSLTVRDIQQSLVWYRDVLGFSIEESHERDGKLRAVSLRAGDARVLLGSDDGAKGFDRVKGEGFSMMLKVENVDELARAIRERGGVLDSEPIDARGMRVFRLRDLDGFRFTFAQMPVG